MAQWHCLWLIRIKNLQTLQQPNSGHLKIQLAVVHCGTLILILEQRIGCKIQIKGPHNPTSQLLPIMSTKCCSGSGEGRKDKGGGGEKMVCDKVVCDKHGVVKDSV